MTNRNTNTNTPAALTPEQKDSIKTAAALVRMTWQVCGIDRDDLMNLLQVAAQDALLTAFDKELVWALELYEDPDNASTARALTKLVRETQAKIAAHRAELDARNALYGVA